MKNDDDVNKLTNEYIEKQNYLSSLSWYIVK